MYTHKKLLLGRWVESGLPSPGMLCAFICAQVTSSASLHQIGLIIMYTDGGQIRTVVLPAHLICTCARGRVRTGGGPGPLAQLCSLVPRLPSPSLGARKHRSGGCVGGAKLRDRDRRGHADRWISTTHCSGRAVRTAGATPQSCSRTQGKIRRSPTWLGSAITRYSEQL